MSVAEIVSAIVALLSVGWGEWAGRDGGGGRNESFWAVNFLIRDQIVPFLGTLTKSAASLPPKLKQLALFWRIEDGYFNRPPDFQ
ncbi:hypothetical protein C8R44DRAFT_863460 [Mycena epipterygia]|nr:hypothetical protein C8R44DRAFT_863460 [Mycena epipterygia]